MTSFSERMGITEPKTIQMANLDMDLRNSLWNVCREFFLFREQGNSPLITCIRWLLSYTKTLYRKPIEALPYVSWDFVQAQLTLFQMETWYKVLDTVEFLHTLFRDGEPEQNAKSTRSLNARNPRIDSL